MPGDVAPLLERIRELLDEQAADGPETLLRRMEHTLTDGYAHALELEAEAIRIEREIADLAGRTSGSESNRLRELSGRRALLVEQVALVRDLLAPLKRRADGLRRSLRAGPPRPGRSGPRTPLPGYGCRSAAS